MHLKNESAAKSFGSNPAWCITRATAHWEQYKDNFLFICDANGERYGINLRCNICDNSADLPVPISNVFDQYEGLEAHISKFYANQLKKAIATKDEYKIAECFVPYDTINGLQQIHNAGFVLTSYDPIDVCLAFSLMANRPNQTMFNVSLEPYRQSFEAREYFDELIRPFLENEIKNAFSTSKTLKLPSHKFI